MEQVKLKNHLVGMYSVDSPEKISNFIIYELIEYLKNNNIEDVDIDNKRSDIIKFLNSKTEFEWLECYKKIQGEWSNQKEES